MVVMNANMHESVGKILGAAGILLQQKVLGWNPSWSQKFVEAFFFMMSLLAMSLEAWDRER